MPRTAQWVIADPNFIRYLRSNLGYVTAQAKNVRIETRPGLPVIVYSDGGAIQGAGNMVTPEQIMAWFRANNIQSVDLSTLGTYIDSPVDQTANQQNGVISFTGNVTDSFETAQVATYLQNNPPVA
jgi:hypothetical protein